jgi:hypothetical protein
VDGGAVVVDAALPSINFAAQCRQVTDSALSQTLAAEQAHFDLGLVKPTAVLGWQTAIATAFLVWSIVSVP